MDNMLGRCTFWRCKWHRIHGNTASTDRLAIKTILSCYNMRCGDILFNDAI